MVKMHADEVDIDVPLVRDLLAQFPEWADLPIEPVRPSGTDNAIYRLGDDLSVRLPRRERTRLTLEKERFWLPRLAPYLPLAVPVPVAEGAPGPGYPFTWSVYGWLHGENATAERIADQREAASALAEFITALQDIDPAGRAAAGRAQLPPRRAPGGTRRPDPHRDRGPRRHDRRRRRDRGVGRSPPRARVGPHARLDPW